MSAQSLAAILTAAASIIGTLGALLHSMATRRIVKSHRANPYVHARTARSNGVPGPRQPSPGGQQPPYNMAS